MKKEKKFFNLISKDVPEKEWEANYLVEKEKDKTKYVTSVIAIVTATMISLALLIILTGTIQCSASIEFEGKGNIILNESELPSQLEKFEFNEGKIKFEGSVPCSFLTTVGMYGGMYNGK